MTTGYTQQLETEHSLVAIFNLISEALPELLAENNRKLTADILAQLKQ